MLTKHELQQAIAEIEALPMNYQNCEKLATFYTLYDHLYTERDAVVERHEEERVAAHSDSEFMRLVAGVPAADAWALVDELVATVQVTNPPLYNGLIRRLQSG